MPTFDTGSNGATLALPTGTKGFSYTIFGGAGGSGGNDAGGPGGASGDGAKLSGTAVLTSTGQTLTCYVGGGGQGGNNGSTGTGGGPGGTGSLPGGTGGNAGGSGSSGAGGGGGGASAILWGSTYICIAGGGGGGGGGSLNSGTGGTGTDGSSKTLSTTISASGGGNGTNKSGDGSGGGAGGGGSPGGAGGGAGQDNSFSAAGGQAGTSAYNSTYHPSAPTLSDTDSESYGYSIGGSNSDGTGGRVIITYPEINFYGIAVGTGTSTQGNVTGTVGESVELTWVTNTAGNVLINGVNQGNGTDGQAYTAIYTGVGAGTTTYTIVAQYNGIDGATLSRSVTLYQPPVIDTFTASPSSYVTTNNSISLSWTTTNATSISLTVNGSSLISNSSNVDSSTTYTPTTAGTYSFVLTAVNQAGGTAGTITSTVNVEAVPPPTIDSFSADPNPADQDTQFKLIWTTSNANTISINQGVGSNLPADGESQLTATAPTSGAGAYPGAPTYGDGYRDYTLTATNLAGTSVTDTERVYVNPQPPIPDFSITPSTIDYGETVTITWSNDYTTSASIDQGVGTLSPASSGSATKTITGNIQDFVDNSSVTFTMSVAGFGGTDTATYSITVNVDTTPDTWTFSNKTGATIDTTYYASSLGTSPL